MLAVGLTILGLELSTKIVSLAAGRVSSGFSAIANGLEFHVSTGRFLTGVAMLVIGLSCAGLGVWLTKAEVSVTAVGEACPACGGETQRVKRRRTHKLLSTLMGHRLTRRRCDVCSWSGLSVRY